ncbi:Gfo/Idh/MocA family protein [Polynucleobacter sp. AP-Ainpum-60-G11]|uniref:Gfo/Idh/MocA family protein n=1 Tax=Polynucleobacter sp. AP-Ainpum-60-G11 TaxID=2576926 RepID=UPI001BFEDDDD|nr:Gfo/Idh/MocA family oxidoreductase [Polynucleobacter sp. AP-Ainpum-60-G11]QWE27026.1 Gfo/Idh/MocA family oxidoreductase [Polynucleobacter sp. AP-Ainpum-60-G11]
MNNFKKLIRFILIYGISYTLFKVMGRSRFRCFSIRQLRDANIGVIGTGQYAYATLGYWINKFFGNKFIACYDIDKFNEKTFKNFYQIKSMHLSADDLIHSEKVKYVYITSNHATHTDYALIAIAAQKITYIEKPISVNEIEFIKLVKAVRLSKSAVYAGYNRPFSKVIKALRSHSINATGPFTLNCFVIGHHLDANHWYRNPEEGTRVCGNIGHWVDLSLHISAWHGLPDKWLITLSYGSIKSRDENLSICLTSEKGDLISIVFSAKGDPFEGVSEAISYHQEDLICKIDNFRSMSIWQGSNYKKYSYFPKDAGSGLALAQPFLNKGDGWTKRWAEVENSTLMLLSIRDMVLKEEKIRSFSFSEAWKNLGI